MDENFEKEYRDDADRFVKHSKMNVNKFMEEVCYFKSVGKGKDKYFIRNNSEFSMQNLFPCPVELLSVISPVKAENGENEEQFKERVARHLKLYGASDWYGWKCSNWGCKWNVEIYDVQKGENEVIYHYDTAWSPNTNFINEIAPKFPLLDFHLKYEEPGCGFAGELKIIGGEIINEGSWDFVEIRCCECGEIMDEEKELNDEGKCSDCAELEKKLEEENKTN